MRVTLEVTSGPQAGNRVRLVAGQVLQVGRTEWADLAIGSDGQMSSLHFALELNQGACSIRDIGSSNGTWVNGEQIQEAVLRNGDEIRAGATTFKAHVEGNAPSDTASIRSTVLSQNQAAATAAASPPSRAVPRPSKPSKAVGYTVEPLPTGLVLYRGAIAELPASALAESLSHTYPLYLIVDFHRIENVPPLALSEMDFLFDWIPESVIAANSPVLLGPIEDPARLALIDQAWGEDAVVCIFSRQQKPALLAQLRAALRSGSDAVLGYCWPSVLGPLLSFFTKKFIQQFMTGIDAILVEFADLPETWQVFARPDFASSLEKLGLKQVAEEPAVASGE